MNNGKIAIKQLVVLTLSIMLAIISYFIPLSESPSKSSSSVVAEKEKKLQPKDSITNSVLIYNGPLIKDLGLLILDPILIPDISVFALSSTFLEIPDSNSTTAIDTRLSHNTQAKSDFQSPEIQFLTIDDLQTNYPTKNSSVYINFFPFGLENFTN